MSKGYSCRSSTITNGGSLRGVVFSRINMNDYKDTIETWKELLEHENLTPNFTEYAEEKVKEYEDDDKSYPDGLH